MARFYEVNQLWPVNTIIRLKTTGHPYLIVHHYKYTAVVVVDLEEKSSPNLPRIVLPKDYSSFAPDHQFKKNGKLTYDPIRV